MKKCSHFGSILFGDGDFISTKSALIPSVVQKVGLTTTISLGKVKGIKKV